MKRIKDCFFSKHTNSFSFTCSHHLCTMQVSFRSQIARVVHIRAGYVWVVLARHFLLISQTAELIKNPTAWTNFNCASYMSCRHAKGQIKPKADWDAVDSPKKRTNEWSWKAKKQNRFVRSFFWRIYSAPIYLWFYLTFNQGTPTIGL